MKKKQIVLLRELAFGGVFFSILIWDVTALILFTILMWIGAVWHNNEVRGFFNHLLYKEEKEDKNVQER
ncbi:MAG: hypothetical protein HY376_03290 [Candidatus Blackburnbacteria bacterium]|nr:hypothetical protein [Candidatus Blackburnbacteria bacterium]